MLALGFGLVGLVGGVLWWWAVLRLAFVPERSGLAEGVIAAGGWGLGLLPVHAAAFRGGDTSSGGSGGSGGPGGSGVPRA
ncbi:hypothetical protein [Streptomyces sp. NPDC058953]|uniref:hypothetical protein n=1 Tax=unclassified Streptomyces TaxID=2593676 RepID=UPI0036A35ABD